MLFKLLAGCLLAVLLSVSTGCSVAQQANLAGVQNADSFSSFLDSIKNVTLKDIETALADVHAKGDVDLAALQCYPALEEFLKSTPTLSNPTIDGVISANQLKRDVLLGGVNSNGPFQMAIRKLHTACAAYVMDERRFAAEFAIMVGAASHGVPPVSALPKVLNSLVP